jgi:hypothetical protein
MRATNNKNSHTWQDLQPVNIFCIYISYSYTGGMCLFFCAAQCVKYELILIFVVSKVVVEWVGRKKFLY